MGYRKRKIINRRQLKVAEVWERDPEQTQETIAKILWDEFGIKTTQRTVSRDLKALDQRNLAKSDAIIEAVKQQLTDEYEHIHGEAMAAWLKSLEDKQTITAENIEAEGGGGTSRIKASERTEGQSGNPALLAQAQAALKAIRDLWGMDKQRDDPGSSEGKPLILKVIKGVSTDDI